MNEVLDIIAQITRREPSGSPTTVERKKVQGLRLAARENMNDGRPLQALDPAARAAFITNEPKDIHYLAQIASRLQLWDEAAALWDALYKRDPTSIQTLRRAARAITRSKDWSEATLAWLRTLQLDPNDSEAEAALAKIERLIASA